MSLTEQKPFTLEQRWLRLTQWRSLPEFSQRHLRYYRDEILRQIPYNLFLVNPGYFGVDEKKLAEQPSFTICSTAVFTRGGRVVNGEPILAPTWALEKAGFSSFILTSCLYQYITAVRKSFSQFAVWGWPKIPEQFWQRVPQVVATQENTKRFAQAMSRYAKLFGQLIRDREPPGEKFLPLAKKVGLLGPWQEMFGGVRKPQDLSSFFDEFQATHLKAAENKLPEGPTHLEQAIVAKFERARSKLSRDDLKLVRLALPVAFVFKRGTPIFYIQTPYHEVLDEIFSEPLPMRSPINTACLPGGLYSEQVEQVFIDGGIDSQSLARINSILASWGCPEAQTTSEVKGIANCQEVYKKAPFYRDDFIRAVKEGGLIRLIGDHSNLVKMAECLYDWEELR